MQIPFGIIDLHDVRIILTRLSVQSRGLSATRKMSYMYKLIIESGDVIYRYLNMKHTLSPLMFRNEVYTKSLGSTSIRYRSYISRWIDI